MSSAGWPAERDGDSFEQLLEAAPDAMVVVDACGRVVLVNAQTEALFGHRREDLIGQGVDLLLPERLRSAHAGHRGDYLLDPRTRPMGADLDPHGLRKDGSEFPVEIWLSSVETPAGRLTTAAIRDLTARRAAGRKFEQLLEFAPDAILGISEDGTIVLVNRQMERLFGYRHDELIGESVEKLVPWRFMEPHPRHRKDYFASPSARPMGGGAEVFGVRKDSTEFPAEVSLSAVDTEDGALAAVAIRDISSHRKSERERTLQQELDRARRLESVGQLAGGIAHDFNNLLAVILNYAEFVTEDLEPGPTRSDVEEIRRAAERAAALTRQLLIFSRREVAKPEVLYLRDVIRNLENLLQGAVGERIELVTRFGEEQVPVEIDPGHLEQVLVNLVVNARDAMPDGGRVVIEVEAAHLDGEYSSLHPGTVPGDYARLKVSDTGTGMDAESAEHAFEPFFTTKEEGTGLGLATVYGIVTGANGRVDIYSEKGIGTTVKIHLPASSRSFEGYAPKAEAPPTGRGEAVLVVEDDADVRGIAERILTSNGYEVFGTADGGRAVELCADPDRHIDLILTDVVMPKMRGDELVKEVRALRPDLSVLFMSGYSHEVLKADAFAEGDGKAFIEKPFGPGELLQTVRRLLDARPGQGERR